MFLELVSDAWMSWYVNQTQGSFVEKRNSRIGLQGRMRRERRPVSELEAQSIRPGMDTWSVVRHTAEKRAVFPASGAPTNRTAFPLAFAFLREKRNTGAR